MKIHFELTPEQTIEMQPLFDAMKNAPLTGAIIGQLWEPEYTYHFGYDNAVAVFEFCTANEVREAVNKAEAEALKQKDEQS